MPSKDEQNRIRTPSFRAKLSAMKGLAPDEKALFQRIGNLVDVLSYAQRQQLAPGRGQARALSRKVPKPQNVTLTAIPGGIELKWDPVDFSELGFYEVQFADTSSFATFEKIETVGTRVVIKADPVGGVLFLRVRTVSKRGLTSEFSTTTSVSTVDNIFNADQDNIDPENRTTVLPHPELLGAALDNNNGSVFTGVGGNVGPSPFTLDDEHSGFSANIDIRHDITYNFHENASPFPGIEDERLETVGQEFLEQEQFYTFEPNFYLRPQILTGSFTDFFNVATLTNDPLQLDVEFLRYRILNTFYFPEHPQAGYVLDASLSTIKF